MVPGLLELYGEIKGSSHGKERQEYLRASPLAPPRGPPNGIWGRRRRKSRSVALPSIFFIRCDVSFYPAHPIQTLSTGGRAGAPAGRVARRVAHCQRHDRRFVVSTRLSPRFSRRITAPAAALHSGAASRRFRTRDSVNVRHACTPAVRRAYKFLSQRHCWAFSIFVKFAVSGLQRLLPPSRDELVRFFHFFSYISSVFVKFT
jgi:hypothetical protein